MNHTFDALVVGAGFAGAVTARELAERGNLRVLVLERRDHIGGNAYDCLDQAGVLIHQYGPHIFHTNNKRVFDYLSRFTQWRDYQHRVIANIPDGKTGGRMTYPVPFNLTSLETAFGLEEGRRLGDKLLEAYGPERKVTILELRQSADPEIAALADYVYEHVFVHYTMKQWGQTPEEIDPNTTARVPVFLSRSTPTPPPGCPSSCPGTTGTSRTPIRACPWRGTPPCLRSCWTTPASRWSWGRTPWDGWTCPGMC